MDFALYPTLNERDVLGRRHWNWLFFVVKPSICVTIVRSAVSWSLEIDKDYRPAAIRGQDSGLQIGFPVLVSTSSITSKIWPTMRELSTAAVISL